MNKVTLVGGGSGGHLTPLIAVAEELKSKNEKVHIDFIGQKQEGLKDVMENENIDESHTISAGKFRRYHGESFISHLLDVKTILLNVRDLFRFLSGTFQAWRLLGKTKPDVIFLKGGFVCVPVGLAARVRGIPYVTHDSDAIPGLANKINAKHAKNNLTAMPADLYPYPSEKTIHVGIPLQKTFKKNSQTEIAKFKKELKIDSSAKVLLCVGGGLGAQNLNHALIRSSSELVKLHKNLLILHISGKKLFEETNDFYASTLTGEQIKKHIRLVDFTTELYKYSAVSDLVLTRGGATNLAEFAVQHKPCVVVPGPHLAGGQQLHNARVLENNDAAVVLQESEFSMLTATLDRMLSAKPKELQDYGDKLNELIHDKAAEKIALILNELAE